MSELDKPEHPLVALCYKTGAIVMREEMLKLRAERDLANACFHRACEKLAGFKYENDSDYYKASISLFRDEIVAEVDKEMNEKQPES